VLLLSYSDSAPTHIYTLSIHDALPILGSVPGVAKVFHAGTALDDAGRVVSAGGRVLCVTALGDTVREAQRNAYAGVAAIQWTNAFHRSDIGWRAIAREQDD